MKSTTEKTISGILFLSIINISTIAYAGGNNTATLNIDTETAAMTHGEKAHENHCYKCHTDTIYTRDNRFVKSIDALSQQVVRCKDGSNIPWFDEDADAVVQFLNNEYYKF